MGGWMHTTLRIETSAKEKKKKRYQSTESPIPIPIPIHTNPTKITRGVCVCELVGRCWLVFLVGWFLCCGHDRGLHCKKSRSRETWIPPRRQPNGLFIRGTMIPQRKQKRLFWSAPSSECLEKETWPCLLREVDDDNLAPPYPTLPLTFPTPTHTPRSGAELGG